MRLSVAFILRNSAVTSVVVYDTYLMKPSWQTWLSRISYFIVNKLQIFYPLIINNVTMKSSLPFMCEDGVREDHLPLTRGFLRAKSQLYMITALCKPAITNVFPT